MWERNQVHFNRVILGDLRFAGQKKTNPVQRMSALCEHVYGIHGGNPNAKKNVSKSRSKINRLAKHLQSSTFNQIVQIIKKKLTYTRGKTTRVKKKENPG